MATETRSPPLGIKSTSTSSSSSSSSSAPSASSRESTSTKLATPRASNRAELIGWLSSVQKFVNASLGIASALTSTKDSLYAPEMNVGTLVKDAGDTFHKAFGETKNTLSAALGNKTHRNFLRSNAVPMLQESTATLYRLLDHFPVLQAIRPNCFDDAELFCMCIPLLAYTELPEDVTDADKVATVCRIFHLYLRDIANSGQIGYASGTFVYEAILGHRAATGSILQPLRAETIRCVRTIIDVFVAMVKALALLEEVPQHSTPTGRPYSPPATEVDETALRPKGSQVGVLMCTDKRETEEELRTLQESLAKCEEDFVSAQSLSSQVRADNSKLSGELNTARAKIADLTQTLEAEKNEFKTTHDKAITEYEKNIAELKIARDKDLADVKREHKAAVDGLTHELNEANEKLISGLLARAGGDEAAAGLKAQIENATKRNTELEKKLDEETRKAEASGRRVSALEGELAKANDEAGRLQKELATANDDKRSLQTALDDLKKEKTVIEEAKNALHKDATALSEQVAKGRVDAAKAMGEAREAYDAKAQEADALKRDKATLEATAKRLGEEKDVLAKQKSELEKQNQSLTEEKNQLENKSRVTESENKTLKTTNDTLTREKKALVDAKALTSGEETVRDFMKDQTAVIRKLLSDSKILLPAPTDNPAEDHKTAIATLSKAYADAKKAPAGAQDAIVRRVLDALPPRNNDITTFNSKSSPAEKLEFVLKLVSGLKASVLYGGQLERMVCRHLGYDAENKDKNVVLTEVESVLLKKLSSPVVPGAPPALTSSAASSASASSTDTAPAGGAKKGGSNRVEEVKSDSKEIEHRRAVAQRVIALFDSFGHDGVFKVPTMASGDARRHSLIRSVMGRARDEKQALPFWAYLQFPYAMHAHKSGHTNALLVNPRHVDNLEKFDGDFKVIGLDGNAFAPGLAIAAACVEEATGYLPAKDPYIGIDELFSKGPQPSNVAIVTAINGLLFYLQQYRTARSPDEEKDFFPLPGNTAFTIANLRTFGKWAYVATQVISNVTEDTTKAYNKRLTVLATVEDVKQVNRQVDPIKEIVDPISAKLEEEGVKRLLNAHAPAPFRGQCLEGGSCHELLEGGNVAELRRRLYALVWCLFSPRMFRSSGVTDADRIAIVKFLCEHEPYPSVKSKAPSAGPSSAHTFRRKI